MRRLCVTVTIHPTPNPTPVFGSDASSSVADASFHAPRRFHPGYSWLGRWLRRRTDRLKGEALHVLIMAAAALVLLLIHYLSWTLLHEAFSTTPGLEAGYWITQLALLAGVLGLGAVGFRPALTVTCDADALRVQQGPRSVQVPLDAVASVEAISAQRYHRHERRYAATRSFIGALGETVVLVRRANGGPVVIALPPDAQAALREQLASVLAPPSAPERAAA